MAAWRAAEQVVKAVAEMVVAAMAAARVAAMAVAARAGVGTEVERAARAAQEAVRVAWAVRVGSSTGRSWSSFLCSSQS